MFARCLIVVVALFTLESVGSDIGDYPQPAIHGELYETMPISYPTVFSVSFNFTQGDAIFEFLR